MFVPALHSDILVTAERLREMFSYEPATGEFTRRIKTSNSVKAGQRAGYRSRSGYVSIRIGKRLYLAHRLAWLYMNGCWPSGHIDHKDGNPSNNRFDNLRPATHSQNSANRKVRGDSSTGVKGVSYNAKTGRWRVLISLENRVRKHVGVFASAEEAHAAYLAAARAHYGEFARG